MRGGGIGGGGRGGEKRVGEGNEGLEGEDFPGKFRETPRPPDPTRTSFAKNPILAGCHPPPYLAYAHMYGVGAFFSILSIVYKWIKNKQYRKCNKL